MAGPFDIFIVGGQSNAMYGFAYNQVDLVAPARLYQIKQNSSVVSATQCMDFPGLNGGSAALISFAVYFCRDYYIPQKLQTGRDVLLVPIAQGGAGFYRTLAKTGGQHSPAEESGYTTMKNLINAAVAAGSDPSNNVIKGFFWQHGEQDAGDSGSGLGDGNGDGYYATMTGAAGYTRYFSEMIAGLKADTTGGKFDSSVPIHLGGPPPDLAYHPTVPQLPNYPSGIGNSSDGIDHHNSAHIKIIQGMAAMPGSVANCAYIDTLNPYKLVTEQVLNQYVVNYYLHFSQASHRELARRYWQGYRRLVDGVRVVSVRVSSTGQPTPPAVTLNGGGFTSVSTTPTINITTTAAVTGDIIEWTNDETTLLSSHTVTVGENGNTAFSLTPTLTAGVHLIGVTHRRGAAKSRVGTIALKIG